MEQFSPNSKKKLEGDHQKVAFSSPEYQEWQLENKSTNEAGYFGKQVLLLEQRANKIRGLESNLRAKEGFDAEAIKKLQGSVLDAYRTKQKELIKEREFILKEVFVKNPTAEQKRLQRAFLGGVMSNSDIVNYFEKVLKEKFSTALKLERVLNSVTGVDSKPTEKAVVDNCSKYFAEHPKKFTPKLLEEIIRERKKTTEELSYHIEKNKDVFIKEFSRKFAHIIQKYELPVSEDVVHARMQGIYMRAVDPFVSRLEKIDGSYVLSTHTVNVSTLNKEQSIEHIVDHELLHAISGGVALKKTAKMFGEVVPDYGHLKHGLSFYGSESQERPDSKKILSWMNEGITEKINSEMNPHDNNSYPEERGIIDCLIDGSNGVISKKDFYTAYFEEYSPEYGMQNSPWRVLVQKFKAVYGPSLIREINDWVEKDGSETALEKLKLKIGLLQ